MIRCTPCGAESNTNRFEAMAEGWRFLEFYGPRGNKYGVACPKETLAKVAELSKDLIEQVSGKK
jgi:hypothetical protein